MTSRDTVQHILSQSSPSFISKLRTNPKQAAEEFADFAYRVLAVSPPGELWSFTGAEREEAIQITILHFIDRDCRVLRLYKDEGEPFSKWFYRAASNRLRDLIDKQKTIRRREVSVDPEPDDNPRRVLDPQDPMLDQLEVISRKDLIEKCLRLMGSRCQALLSLFLQDKAPDEIGLLLKYPAGPARAKNVSTDISHCLATMTKRVATSGLVD